VASWPEYAMLLPEAAICTIRSDRLQTALTQRYISLDVSSVGAPGPWCWPVCDVPA
jgi:hypothetical protein